MHSSVIKRKYQVFTPEQTVDEMLSLLQYGDSISGKSFLENSCGDGRFLVKVVALYVRFSIKAGLSNKEIVAGLERDIVGYELDKAKLKKCRRVLDDCAKSLGISCKIKWNLHNEDFLRADILRKFDFVVGNPPYLSYWDIPVADREYLRESFSTCRRGLCDYSFAFIEKSLSLLKDDVGQFCYIIPSSIFKTQAALSVRRLLIPHLKCIQEYGSRQVFGDVLTSSAILLVDNGYDGSVLHYRNMKSQMNDCLKIILRADLMTADAWYFSGMSKGDATHRFGDAFKVSAGVATLCNSAFVLNGWRRNGNALEDVKTGELIELGIVKCAVTPRGCKSCLKQYIIFPYKRDGRTRKLCAYTEDELCSRFPNAYAHLLRFKELLLKRDADKGAKWYEYGRSQALSSIDSGRLLLSQVVTKRARVYTLKRGDVPYSGYYVQPTGKISLATAQKVLSSRAFAEYAKMVGVPVNGSSSRLTTSDIANYRW